LFWQVIVEWLAEQGLKRAAVYLTGAVGGFWGFRKWLETSQAASLPRNKEIMNSVHSAPNKTREKFARILSLFDESYPDLVNPVCHDAANDTRELLQANFGRDPEFSNFRFSQDRTWHSYLRAPTNYATVTWNAGTPKDETDDFTLFLYAGSDRIYPGIYVPAVSPYKVESGSWSFMDYGTFIVSNEIPRYPGGTGGYWPEFNFR
jgi:hypothetical protein